MTTFNTGNSVPSVDVKDLYDNAENLDVAMNDREHDTWLDRLGVSRQTWHGIEQRAQVQIDRAEEAAQQAIAAASASGSFVFAEDLADMAAKLPQPEGTVFEVFVDSSQGGSRTRYVVNASGVPVFAVNLDKLRGDLMDPAMGAMIVAFLNGRTVKDKLLDEISIKDHGAVGDGSAADAALSAAIAAANGPALIRFPAGSYAFTSKKILTAANMGLRFVGDGEGTTTIVKQFNGDLFELDACPYHSVSEMTLDGQYGTFTGRAALVKANSHYPRYENFTTKGFSGEHIAFEGDAGFGASIDNHTALAGDGQPAIVAVKLLGKDTGYSVRRITNPNYAGSIDLAAGCDNVFITSGQLTKVVTSNNVGHLFIQGTRWGNAGIPVEIYGNTFVVNCSFAQNIKLMAGFDGSFMGNRQDGGSAPFFENESFSGSVFHSAPDGKTYIGKAFVYPSVPGTIETSGVNSVGDTDYTYIAGASPSILIFDTALSANRAIVLPTVGVTYGTKLRVTRTGVNVGGPWTLLVGSTGKTMVAGTWCDLIYNGSYWAITATGTVG